MSIMRCEECERFVDTDAEEVQWLKTSCVCERCWEDEGPPEFDE